IAEETAKESLELTQNSYFEGAVSVIQLIDAQTNYLQAQLASSTANYKYLMASFRLERAVGHFFLLESEESNKKFLDRAKQHMINNKIIDKL
ncbi:MAG: TolC family protein, partial [Rhodothermaceae bacterium]